MKIDLLLPRGKNPLSYYNSIMNLNTISLALVGKTNKGIKTLLGRLGQKESHRWHRTTPLALKLVGSQKKK
jgi:hypothetical protein